MENNGVDEVEKNTPSENKSDVPVSPIKAHQRINRKAAVYVIGICLLVLLLFIGTIIGLFYHYYSLVAVSSKEDDYSHAVSLTDEDLSEIPDGTVELPEEDVIYQKDVVNILLIGTDERTKEFDKYARADSIMILSLNKKTNVVKLVSLERGMLVKIPGRQDDILTHTFHYGGVKLVMQTVHTHFNLDVQRYVRVNFVFFEKLVNEVGGVDISLTKEEAAALNELLHSSKLKEGTNHLDGSAALLYSRLRSIDSDWHRIKRQRNVIGSIKNNMKGKSVGELNTIVNECLPYVQTNLTSIEFADLLFHMPDYVSGDFQQMTIPKKGTYQGLGNVDFKANSKILRDFIYDESSVR